MEKISLIIDCDPGLDDAIEILMALASPDQLDVLGITTVAGNTSLEKIHSNARRMCELAGRPDIKVFGGCPRSFFSQVVPSTHDGEDIHGETGLGGCKLPPPRMPLQSQHGVSFIIDTCLNAEKPVTVAASGPLTNIAAALILEPRITQKIERIVLMGGAIRLGNITPSAEFNFYSDPHAAHVVFTSGVPLVMLGLDVTHKTQISERWIDHVKSLGTPVSQAVVDILSYFYRPDAIREPGVDGGVIHDANVIAYLVKPDLYKGRHVYVEIDVSPTIAAGRSTVDWYGKLGKKPNALVLDHVDVPGFFDLLMEKIAWYGPTGRPQP